MSAIDATLNERGSRYGEFPEHASITQSIKEAMSVGRNWGNLDDDMKEALEMTAHKIGRILNGDPNYVDSWHDIIGYIRLVEQRLEREQGEPGMSTTSNDQKSPDFNAKLIDALTSAARAKKAEQPVLNASPGIKEMLEKAFNDAAEIKPEPKEYSCPACTLRRKLSAMFPDAEIDVTFLSEDTGRTD